MCVMPITPHYSCNEALEAFRWMERTLRAPRGEPLSATIWLMPPDIRERLVSLSKEAAAFCSDIVDYLVAIEKAKPVIARRDKLKHAVFLANAGEPLPGGETLASVQTSLSDANNQLAVLWEPIRAFEETQTQFIYRVRVILKRVPLSQPAMRIRDEIERLPSIHGVGQDWETLRDDFSALTVRLEELASAIPVSSAQKRAARITVPPDATWPDVAIRFLSDHRVEIKVGSERHTLDYAEAGFEDRRSQKPNTAWVMLRQIAKDQRVGRPVTKPVAVEKAIQSLRKTLQALFGLQDDPVLPFRQVKSYQPKFQVSVSNHEG
jgi:hypothetical protein